MPKFYGTVTQTGADTFTAASIATGLTADGKAGWNILGLSIEWTNGNAVAAADWKISGAVSTLATEESFSSVDEIARVSWGLQNTAGVAVAVPYEPIKTIIMDEPRLTVQPYIYIQAISAATGAANSLQYQLIYEVVKLTDLEVLRLLAGGA